MKNALFGFILFNLLLSSAIADGDRPPNIVFIIADDLGWGDVAFHGGNTPTPNLDKLAREGVELMQHTVAPVCSPTRVGLLTGRCWSRFGVNSPMNTRCLAWDTVTLPRALKQVGYTTCLTGKWHLGSKPEWRPNLFGFDHSYGSLAGGVSPWNHRYKKGSFAVTWHRNGELIEESGHVTDLITKEAIQWLESQGDAPFFLYVPYTAVHLPLKEPEEWLQRVSPSIQEDVPRHYSACLRHLDDSIGKILTTLERLKVREKTLFIFTSDNGGNNAENNDLNYPDDNCPNGKLVGNSLPFRGRKASVYEGGIRVPTIVSWPSRLRARQISTPVQITDWMPTFCSIANCKIEADLKWDGIDISKLLLEDKPLPNRPIYTVGPDWAARALRMGDWKLVATGEETNRKIELFNIGKDPYETKNLSESEPSQLTEMLKLLDQVAARDRDAVVKN